MTDAIVQKLALAERYLDLEQPARAVEVLQGLPAEALGLERTWWLRGLAARAVDDSAKTIQIVSDGLGRFPQSVALLVLLSDALVDEQQLVDAEQVLLRALAVDPECVEALCDYALVMMLVGQTAKARALVERAASLAPLDGDVWAARYNLAHLTGDDRATRRITDELADLSDGHAKAVAMLAVEAEKRGDYGAVWRLLRQAAAADPSIVEMFGREAFLEAKALRHPLMVPLWPVQRFGPGLIWILAMGVLFALRALEVSPLMVAAFAVAFVGYAVYSWVAPPLARRLSGASP